MDSKKKRRANVKQKHRKRARKVRKRTFHDRWLDVIRVNTIVTLGTNVVFLIRAVYSAVKIIGEIYTGIVAIITLFQVISSFELFSSKAPLVFFFIVVLGVLTWKKKN